MSTLYKNLPGLGGQSWVLQEEVFSLKPEQDPPLLSDTVLYLLYFCDPPPQLLEHGPIGVQLDHWQSTENKMKFSVSSRNCKGQDLFRHFLFISKLQTLQKLNVTDSSIHHKLYLPEVSGNGQSGPQYP